jgi:hypothetical protein
VVSILHVFGIIVDLSIKSCLDRSCRAGTKIKALAVADTDLLAVIWCSSN